jgi:hypothetical protein
MKGVAISARAMSIACTAPPVQSSGWTLSPGARSSAPAGPYAKTPVLPLR